MLTLVAAYAVAVQAILIVVAGPLAGATAFADRPICSSLGAGAAGKGPDGSPAGHAHDCLAACLTGCCAVPPPEVPLAVVLYAPRSTGTCDRCCRRRTDAVHQRDVRPSLTCPTAWLTRSRHAYSKTIFALWASIRHGVMP